MHILDPGHKYALPHLDGSGEEILTFVKREGVGYPGNVGSHPGTNIQDVLRALIDRVYYLDEQIPCKENKLIVTLLRTAIRHLEVRAAKRHWREFREDFYAIEKVPFCSQCGHIYCPGH